MSWLSKLLGYVPAEERKGISLGQVPHWKVGYVKDFPAFLRALVDLVPSGSILYIEGGGNPPKEIISYLEERAARKTSKVAMGTIWPRPRCDHMQITKENLEGLANLAEMHAELKPAVHLHVYKDNKVLLQWYDAFFDDPFYVSKEIPEKRLIEFCDRLGTKYEKDIEDAKHM